MTRDIDKEKKDQRKAESLALREVRKQQVLQTVLRASNLAEAAKTLDTNGSELRARLEKYGVKHSHGERWNVAVKDYIDAGQPHQYELPVSSFYEFATTPPTKRELYEDAMRRKSIQNYGIEVVLEQEIKARNSDDKPRYLNFEEKNLQMEFKTLQMEAKLEQEIKARNLDLETKLEQKLLEAVREGYDEAELIVPDPASPNRTIKYTLPLR